jgi:type 1 glutamine amidotransferase
MDAGEDLDAGPAPGPVRILIFSRTTGFRHDSIEPARSALAAIAQRRNAVLETTEDPAVLIGRLEMTDVVVFLMTTGDVLDAAQQQQFEAYIRQGGGFAGVHSAADTEYDWPFYGELNGAWFKDHPAVQAATIIVDATDDPLVSFLPREWMRSDEWYNFRENPRSRVKVLLRLDESTYSGGNMGADHPIAWTRTIDQGRAFYTGLGHTPETWEEPLVLRHVEQGVFWAAGR